VIVIDKPATSVPMSLGFIGGSINSAVGYTHFVSSAMDNEWILDAGCFSTNTERNLESARVYGVASERVYDIWQDMVAKEKGRLDAIVVLTPTPAHFEVVMACLNEGIPVICEKSLATSSADAKKILETRDFRNGFLAVTYNYSGYPMVRELRTIIQGGTLGKILHFQAEMPQEGYIRVDAQGNKPAPQSWRLSDGQVPIIHLDLGSHLHQLIHYLVGQKPIEVIADQDSYGWFSGVIDNVTCLCRYSERIQGQMWFSKSALGHRNGLRLRIYGSKASAEWYQMCPEELVLSYADGHKAIIDRASNVAVANMGRYNRFKAGHPAGFIEAFANLYGDIADCLCQYRATGQWRSENVFSAELALEGIQMIEAMSTSVDRKTWQIVQVSPI
jgi:predicted dehydrogenase